MASDTKSEARGKPFIYSDGTTAKLDWLMPSNARYLTVRFRSCSGDGDGSGVTHYAYPSFRKLGANGFDTQGAVATPWGVTFLGRYGVATATNGGEQQTIGASAWTTISLRTGVGFSFVRDYGGFYNIDTQELVTRVCLAYGDNLSNSPQGKGTIVRLARVSCKESDDGNCEGKSDPKYTGNGPLTGDAAALNSNRYDAGTAFW